MSIECRCTGCRSRLHVPQRRAGATVSCPKCGTRVVVPAATLEDGPTSFEHRSVERSLASLEAGRGGAGTRGGIVAEDSFELPDSIAPDVVGGGMPRREAGLTLTRWAIYLYAATVALVAVGAFLVGSWWPFAGVR